MRNRLVGAIGLALAAILFLGGCSGSSSVSNGQIQGHQISWLISRPADAAVIKGVQGLAAEYATTHPGFSLNLITTPDRPSFLQKFETLAAADQLPGLFDTHPTPFTKKPLNQGNLGNVPKALKD